MIINRSLQNHLARSTIRPSNHYATYRARPSATLQRVEEKIFRVMHTQSSYSPSKPILRGRGVCVYFSHGKTTVERALQDSHRNHRQTPVSATFSFFIEPPVRPLLIRNRFIDLRHIPPCSPIDCGSSRSFQAWTRAKICSPCRCHTAIYVLHSNGCWRGCLDGNIPFTVSFVFSLLSTAAPAFGC